MNVFRKLLGKHSTDKVEHLNQQVDQLYQQGQYELALPLARQVYDLARRQLDKLHPGYAASLNNLGLLLLEKGDYAQAESLLCEAGDIWEQTVGQNHLDYVYCLDNLATLYIDTGDYVQAEELMGKVEIILRTVPIAAQDYATILNNHGMLYQEMGENEQAERYYKQANDIRCKTLGENHPYYATSLMNLGTLYQRMGDYAKAESYLSQAKGITVANCGESQSDSAACLSNLAELYQAVGDYSRAEPLLHQALKIRRKVLGDHHPYTAITISCLAMLSAAMERYDEAMAWTQESDRIYNALIDQVFGMSSERGRLALLEKLRLGLDFHLSLLVKAFSDDPVAKRIGMNLVLRRKAIVAEAQGMQRLAILSERHKDLMPQWQMIAKFRTEIAQLMLSNPEQLTSRSSLAKVTPEDIPGLLDLLTAAKEEMERVLARQLLELKVEEEFDALDCQVVANKLPADSVLIEFIQCYRFDFSAIPAHDEQRWKPEHYLAFVLSASDPHNVQMLDLGEANRIDGMIASFRASIIGAATSRDARRQAPIATVSSLGEGTALRSAIFDPLLSALGGQKRLFLAPDGDLTQLPFEVLPTDNGHHLIDNYNISYLSVGRDLLRIDDGDRSHRQPTESLVAADPDFDLSIPEAQRTPPSQVATLEGQALRDLIQNTMPFSRLPYTRVEGEKIAKLLGVQPLLGNAVLESRLKSQPSPYIMHIATHGFFLPNQPLDPNKNTPLHRNFDNGVERLLHVGNPLLRSGLALAGANTWCQGGALPMAAEDAILNGEDVACLDLHATQLVVLSACETGLGEVQHGQGVFGLRRAFALAGANTLVMSLWKVPDDQQTQELMEDFYRRILAGEPRADALRKAQLVIKEKYPNPFYWGAFICQGDPGPLLSVKA